LLDELNVRLTGPGVLSGRRHLPGGDPLEKRRFVNLAGNNLLARDQFLAVEDEIHPPLDTALLTVTAVAIGAQDGNGLDRHLSLVGVRGHTFRDETINQKSHARQNEKRVDAFHVLLQVQGQPCALF